MAWIFGVVLLVIGVLGLIPLDTSGGFLFGVFAVDTMSSVVYIATGALAILAARQDESRMRLYFKVFGIVYALITVLGFIEGSSVLGLMVVNFADNLLNLLVALVALWAGFGSRELASM